jgi:hypothetical protein
MLHTASYIFLHGNVMPKKRASNGRIPVCALAAMERSDVFRISGCGAAPHLIRGGGAEPRINGIR